jgi:hypothetical protein
MATVAGRLEQEAQPPDQLSGTSRAHAIDRWIYVIMAVWFIVIVLTGFVPDSMAKVAAVQAGRRPPFPLVLHLHALLMGAFLLLLLTQTTLVAIGRCDLHRRLGLAGIVLAPALVVVGFILAPTIYHQVWGGAQFGPPPVRAALAPVVPMLENILLLQIHAGILFSLFIGLGLRARTHDAGFHKRMMILATAVPLGAALDRMTWLPTTLPARPTTSDLYILAAVAPMFAWDVIRNRRIHRAYWVWLPTFAAASILVAAAWDTPWWHATARRIMGV